MGPLPPPPPRRRPAPPTHPTGPHGPHAGAGTEETKSEAPWLLRVLGLGDSASADDDSFWEDKVAKPTQPTGTSPAEGAAGAAGEGTGEDEPAEEDDTEGIDTLEDLFG
jgi:hypothetical protein